MDEATRQLLREERDRLRAELALGDYTARDNGPHQQANGEDDQPTDEAEKFKRDEHIPPEFSEDALALRFAERHQNELRYVAAWGQWRRFDGRLWVVEDTLRAYDYARAICRESASRCNNLKIAAAIAAAKTVAAVERLAKADRRHAATTGQWDTNPWLLNLPDGTVDLRTGERSPHRPADFITNLAGTVSGGPCTTWLAFLDRVTAGDKELQAFLQRMAGLALTGITRDHALFFLYGTGANGKSVFISTLAGILGDYHRTAPIETFTVSSMDRHPTEIAGLRGARLVTATETEEGRQWAESRIKTLTGGDKQRTRFMRQDFFDFIPEFKLLIAGNHKPGLRSVDEAIRRRFHLTPFTVTIPPKERDRTLTERLTVEWPGIMAWAIEGCLEWQKIGLAPPRAVLDATAAYLEAEDALLAWVAERCIRNPQAWTRSSDLFADWKAWATRAGEAPGTNKRFSQNLESRGFAIQRRTIGNGFIGLQLVPAMTGSFS